mgnify:FL=1
MEYFAMCMTGGYGVFTARNGQHRVRLLCSWRSIPLELPPLVFSPGGGDKTLTIISLASLGTFEKP